MEIAASIKALKAAADVYGKAKKIPEQKQILEGLAVISVLQQEKFDLQEEVRGLATQKTDLEMRLKSKEDYHLEMGVHWLREDKEKTQPFCPVCYSKGHIVPLQKNRDGHAKDQTEWKCPDKTCGAYLNPWDYKEPDPEWQPINFY